MLKQGVVQETLAELAVPGALPPLHNLPQWSRINTLDKARYPKPFLKDRLQPLPNPLELEGAMFATQGQPDEGAKTLDTDTITHKVNPTLRIQHLEKSIAFLQGQHREVLSHLHEEIDRLKQENKELQFRIVMIQKPQTPHSADEKPVNVDTESVLNHATQGQAGRVPQEKVEDLRRIFLEEEIKELKKALADERDKNRYLQQLLERAEMQLSNSSENSKSSQVMAPQELGVLKAQSAGYPHSNHGDRGVTHSGTNASDLASSQRAAFVTHSAQSLSRKSSAHTLPYNATLNPLQVHLHPQQPRTPTIKECQVILRHLQKLNDKQAHELTQLKTDLRDVLYSHKWTPDAYLLAKAYIAEDDEKEAAQESKLPKIPFKPQSRKLPDVAYVQKDAVSLPALSHTMGTKAIERRRRTQILQKSRFQKEVSN